MGTREVSLMLTGQCFITPLPGPLKNKQTNIQGYIFFQAMLAPSCDFHHSHQHSPKFEEFLYQVYHSLGSTTATQLSHEILGYRY